MHADIIINKQWERANEALDNLGQIYAMIRGIIDLLERESALPVWSKYSNAQRVSSLHLPQGRLNRPSQSDTYSSSAEGVAMDWKTMLTYISGSVDEELLLRNEYLVVENRVLRNQLQGRLRLTDGERRSLAEIGKRLGKQARDEIASIVNPDTILSWHRRLVAKKFDSSKNRQYPGRPRVDVPSRPLWSDHGMCNRLLDDVLQDADGPSVECHERLGGLLRYYYRAAA